MKIFYYKKLVDQSVFGLMLFLLMIYSQLNNINAAPHQPLKRANITIQKQGNTAIIFYAFPGQGWYLISLPVNVTDNSAASLFPMAAGVFTFESQNYRYVRTDQIEIGKGYWLAIPEAAMAVIDGTQLTEFSEHYIQGWHLLGSVIDSVDFSQPNEAPPNSILLPLFSWDDVLQEYYATTTIEKSYGHWMAVYQECDVTVSCNDSPGLARANATAESGDFNQQFGSQPPPPPFVLHPELNALLPKQSNLAKNYPNPFNSNTIISYELGKKDNISLTIHNILGQKVRTLFQGFQITGAHQVSWDGRDDTGELVSSGVYLYRLETTEMVKTNKMLFVK